MEYVYIRMHCLFWIRSGDDSSTVGFVGEWESEKEVNMIKEIAICDKCGKEMNPYTESNDMTIKRDDKYFTSTTSIQLCDECYKEFMRTYLHENN